VVWLTLALKIAAITLTLWKKGENFDTEKLKSQSGLSASREEPVHLQHASLVVFDRFLRRSGFEG
jgi:hypothetical protein